VVGFTSPDYVLFVQSRILYARRLDLAKRVLTGDVIRVAEGVDMNAPSSSFSVSRTAALVYWDGPRTVSELTWVDRQGKAIGPIVGRGRYGNVAVSPDGQQVAVDRLDTVPNAVWIIDLARGGALRRLTADFFAFLPQWSPDSKRVAYSASKESAPNLYVSRADGQGSDEQLTRGADVDLPSGWSPDGQFIVFVRGSPKTDLDIWIQPLSGDRAARPIINSAFTESEARVSPDGRWLAYTSSESGSFEVYVTSFPAPGERWLVSQGGGRLPTWRRDGRELYYRKDRQIMAVPITPGATFRRGLPSVLFDDRSIEGPGFAGFDVAPDGRFLLRRVVEHTSPPLTVVSDWRAGVVQ
jgi:dipeptidyl aminopeptidase/acylaminoacyl peptidase